MANTDNLVPQEALQELAELDKQLATTQKSMYAVFQEAANIRKSLSDASISYRDLTDSINKVNKVTRETLTETSNFKKNLDERARLEQKIIALETEEGKEIAKLRLELQQKTKATKDAIREENALAGSMDQMKANLSKMNAEYSRMSLFQRMTKEGQALQKEIRATTDELKKLEAANGFTGRNVGNYPDGGLLSFQVQQLARELPSLTNGLQMYFLAISNNLSMFVDELNKVKEANKQLNNEGKQGVSIWKQLAGSIFSFQTLLIVVITLLSMFGKEIVEWVKGLSSAGKEVDNTKKRFEDFNKELESSASSFGEKIVKVKQLQEAWNALGGSLSEQNKFIKENKEHFDDLGASVTIVHDAENLLVNNTDAFIESLRLRAKATAAFNLASKAYEEMITLQNQAEGLTRENTKPGVFDVARIAFLQYSDIDIDQIYLDEARQKLYDQAEARKADADAYFSYIGLYSDEADAILKNAGIKKAVSGKAKEFVDKEREAYNELMLFLIQQEAEKNKTILSDAKKAYDERIAALNNYVIKQKDAILKSEQNQLSDEKLTASQRQLIHAKAEAEINKVYQEANKLHEGITKDYADSQAKIIENAYKKRQAEISEAESNELQRLAAMYAADELTSEEYQQGKTDTALRYSDMRMQAEINYLSELMSVVGLSAEEQEKIEANLQAALAKYKKESADISINESERAAREREKLEKDLADKTKKIEKDLADSRKEILQDSTQFINSMFEAQTQKRLDELDELQEAGEKHTEKEIKRVEEQEEAGAISKEQADAQKALIDWQAERREEEIERKRAEIQREAAIREKAIRLLEIAVDTASAVAKIKASIAVAIVAANALSPLTFGMPWAGVIAGQGAASIAMTIATGAMQAAAVAAQPLPKYAAGTDNHPGGLAYLGDGGKRELAILPSGGALISPSHSTLFDLPEGTKVLPDYNMLAKEALRIRQPEKENVAINIDISELLRAQNKTNAKLDELVMNSQKTRANSIYAMKMARLNQQIERRKNG